MSADIEDVRAALLALWLSVAEEADRISPFAMEQLGADEGTAVAAYAMVHNVYHVAPPGWTWMDALERALLLAHAETP